MDTNSQKQDSFSDLKSESDFVSAEKGTVTEDSAMDTSRPLESSPLKASETIEGKKKETGRKSTLKNFALSETSVLPYKLEEDSLHVFKTLKSNTAADNGSSSKKKKVSDEKEKADCEKIDEDFEVISISSPSPAPIADTASTKIESVSGPQTVESPFVTAAIEASQKTFTENMAPTFSTSNDYRLDFFFGIMEQTSYPDCVTLLKQSWSAFPLDTLKLLANLRDIRGGKGIRPQYQQCLYWMYENHQKTLYENLNELVNFGYWKDVLHLLVIILFDGYMHPYFEHDANPSKSSKRSTKAQIRKAKRKNPRNSVLHMTEARKKPDTEKRIYNQLIADHYKIGLDVSRISKHEMLALRLKYSREKFQKDVKYRVFHTKIAEIFATQLIKDLGELKTENKSKHISLAGKWAPSLEGHFDRYTLIGTTISLEIMKKTGQDEIFLSKSIPVATYLARKTYHKEYCIPLRRYHEIPEHMMSTNQWDKVNYRRVPAKCMKKNKTHFIKHDKDRFETYLNSKDCKVAGASLKPVEIICEAMSLNRKSETERIVLEKQWESLAESIKKNGKSLLKNAVSVCDVSGSMSGVPMQAAIGLTLLTMQMTEAPWNNICITFSESPEIFNLDPDLKLLEKLGALEAMAWGMNTDLHKVFELIVSLGQKNKLSDDQMPKLLFIFTDMEFDAACRSGKTNFEAGKELFLKNGYTMPSVVFWNLRDSHNAGVGGRGISTSTPVQKNELGVFLLSGFSGQLLKCIMDGDDLANMTPLTFLLDVINNEQYGKLVIAD